MAPDASQYDFIVVGAGPAGSTTASRLANTQAKPRVLLVEAGASNNDVNLRIDANKFIQMLTPSQNWGYKSVPSDYLGGREIDLARGKGLGGSSGINFTVWTIGPKDDMNTMFAITGDQAWKWEHALERWKNLESFDSRASAGREAYLDPQPANHGYTGPLRVGFSSEWETDLTAMMDIWLANGYKINKDASSGEHLGLSVSPLTSFNGVRVTAADLISTPPSNLTILTEAQVHRVLFEGDRAVGISLVDGRELFASKEVILSAGALESPKILMHSGIGPRDQLTKFGIPVFRENANVGQNNKDHYYVWLKYQRAEETSIRPAFFRDKARQAAALREWELYRTGEYATIGCEMPLGFFKSEAVLKSAEFNELDPTEKARISAPTIPSYEISFNATSPDYYISPENAPALASIGVFLHNSQSSGEMKLQSSDPTVPLAFNPRFLEHPYDRRVVIEATREVLKVTSSKEFQKNTVKYLLGPKSDSESDIIDYWKQTTGSTWHTSGSLSMGKTKEENACVDTEFKVFGVHGLRVADMSIMPFSPSCHTQTTAYQIGMIAAEKIAREHKLE